MATSNMNKKKRKEKPNVRGKWQGKQVWISLDKTTQRTNNWIEAWLMSILGEHSPDRGLAKS